MDARRTSPTVRRRRLASILRRLRDESGLSLEQVAAGCDVTRTTIHRLEAAAHAPKVNDIKALAAFYKVGAERAEEMAVLARESRLKGWWQVAGSSIPAWFETYVGLEEEASDLRSYQPELVIGLLQTEGYFRALLRTDPSIPEESTEELDRRVAVRMKRQERLTGLDAPKLWVILNEAVLRREVGGRAVMREQLRHLITMSRRKNITIQVVPFSAGAHAGVDGAFYILGFPDTSDPALVYVQYRRGGLYLEEASDLSDFIEIFEHLRAEALPPDDSVELIGQIDEELSRPQHE